MAKVIRYQFLSAEINRGTEEQPEMELVFLEKSMEWTETNELTAKREAWGGEYAIEDDGLASASDPTLEDRVGTLEADTADLSEALDMILNEVTQ